MKVLLINNSHTLSGGANTVFFNTSELLKKHGNEVMHFCMRSSSDEDCEESRFFPRSISKGGTLSYISSFFYNKEAKQKLKLLLNEFHPDIVHVHLLYGGLSSSVLKLLHSRNIPIVYTVHDYRLICPRFTLMDKNSEICTKCKNGRYWHCLSSKCYKGSLLRSLILTGEIYFRQLFYKPSKIINKFIFVSNFGYNIHTQFDSSYCLNNSVVIYNFRNDSLDNCSITTSNNYSSYYLYYGRLAYEKGLTTLIRAFVSLKDLKLVILGSGPMEDSLKSIAKENEAKNITFVSHKKGKELFDIVQNAKFIMMPSEWYEMLGMTIVEGNSLGVPSISADIGGLGEIVQDGITGFKFHAGNIDSLQQTILKADQLDRQRYESMRVNAKQFSTTLFNSEEHYKRLMEVYINTIHS